MVPSTIVVTRITDEETLLRMEIIVYFQGRLAHEGLASLIAYRMSKLELMTLISFNDYGLNLNTNSKKDLTITEWQAITPDGLIEELLDCMNQSEMAKRQFRDVARVAGLIFKAIRKHKNRSNKYRHRSLFLMFFQSTILKIYYLFRQEKKFLSQLEAKRLIENDGD